MAPFALRRTMTHPYTEIYPATHGKFAPTRFVQPPYSAACVPFRWMLRENIEFEAVQVADNFAKEDHCLYLALCPLCAAKYTVLVKKDENRLTDFIWAVEQANAVDPAVSVHHRLGT